MRRTKIVCTVGPASSSPAMVESLIRAGMDVARLNFSHGDYDEHLKRIQLIRETAKKLGRTVGILQDLTGPKIRLGKIGSGSVELVAGKPFTFTVRDVPGDERCVTLPYPEIFGQVKPHQMIYVDDAKLQLRVTDVTSDEITTRVVVGGPLGSRKGVTIPNTCIGVSGVTEKDKRDLAFGLQHGVDWVAASFVRTPLDLLPLQDVMQSCGKRIPLIAKIERPEAVRNIVDIIRAYDGAMVARGDLGIEVPIEEVPGIQKNIIRHCNRLGKPVIIATQMLDSMITNPRPTRAEVTDVANAIIDGADATMLSGETAAGAYPVQSVKMMDKIARATEKSLDYRGILRSRTEDRAADVTEAIGEAAANLAEDLRVPAIITCTFGGTTARLVSKFRPKATIVAAASNDETARQLALSWGVHPIYVPMAEDTDGLIANAVDAARQSKLVKSGDTVVIIAGVPVGLPGNTSLIRVVRVG